MYTTEMVNRHVFETSRLKSFRSKFYNYDFDKQTGLFARWGQNRADDPNVAPSPEILDLEISVNGCPNGCKFCYKGNTPKAPTNMSFDTFKTILDKMPQSLTQIAFGITGVQTNPDFISMMEYCRLKGVIPNFTLSGIDLTSKLADEISLLVGAVAVSAYQTDKDVCYDTVKKFTSRGLKQTNIHLMVSNETLPFVYEVLSDRLMDSRLADMNAVVFLGVKPKGRARNSFSPVRTEDYIKLVELCLSNDIAFGFDSCSAPKFEASIANMKLGARRRKQLLQASEPCESSLFSAYINVDGKYWNCSFSEDEEGIEPINVLAAHDFVRDVWRSDEVMSFRRKLLMNKRECFVFQEINV